MKGNWIKYIFIIFIILVMIAVIHKVNEKENQKEEEQPKVSMDEEVIKDMTLGVASFDTINPILSQNKHVQEISRIIYEPLFELDSEYKLQNV